MCAWAEIRIWPEQGADFVATTGRRFIYKNTLCRLHLAFELEHTYEIKRRFMTRTAGLSSVPLPNEEFWETKTLFAHYFVILKGLSTVFNILFNFLT